ncbi:hypothetical protein VNO80_00882 [Phaseolus coccineus]|uniref:Uncharacterized protein n=1 Tax=Phaseolus coccineus TaxID=3886 RepID=A0AAN9NZE1_PHACN
MNNHLKQQCWPSYVFFSLSALASASNILSLIHFSVYQFLCTKITYLVVQSYCKLLNVFISTWLLISSLFFP